jgi:small nuclear ribonucleoprotein (snRNP)-like protein
LKLKFNSLTDVPIELKNGMEELLNGMEQYVNNIIKEITENNPSEGESSDIKFEQV